MVLTRWLVLWLLLGSISAYSQEVKLISGQRNFLYYNVPNQIQIWTNGKPANPNQYQVKIEGAIHTTTDTCLWVTPNSWQVALTINNPVHPVPITQIYKVQYPPLPDVILDGKIGGGQVAKWILMEAGGFTSRPNFTDIRGAKMEVVQSYWVEIKTANETSIMHCNGPLLNDTLKAVINKMKPYDKAIFYGFSFGPLRTVYQPIVIEIGNPYNFGNYVYDVLAEYKSDPSSWNGVSSKMTYDLPCFDYGYFDNIPRIVESNCNAGSDTCTMHVYYRINGSKTLAYIYKFGTGDSMRAQYYYNDVLLADVGYCNDKPTGAFTLYYPNGTKLREGQYEKSDKQVHDTAMVVDPLTGSEAMQYHNRSWHVQEGMWKYYDNGIPIKTVWYRKGEEVSPEDYYRFSK